MFNVYILQSEKDQSFYIGYSNDIVARLEKHNKATKGYTSTKKPWNLVYKETYESKTEAIKRERYIKAQKSRIFIQNLIDCSAS